MSTKDTTAGNGNVVLQVGQVERALRTVYLDAGLLDTSDLEGMAPSMPSQSWTGRSRTSTWCRQNGVERSSTRSPLCFVGSRQGSR
jgi:hypothetical protein